MDEGQQQAGAGEPGRAEDTVDRIEDRGRFPQVCVGELSLRPDLRVSVPHGATSVSHSEGDQPWLAPDALHGAVCGRPSRQGEDIGDRGARLLVLEDQPVVPVRRRPSVARTHAARAQTLRRTRDRQSIARSSERAASQASVARRFCDAGGGSGPVVVLTALRNGRALKEPRRAGQLVSSPRFRARRGRVGRAMPSERAMARARISAGRADGVRRRQDAGRASSPSGRGKFAGAVPVPRRGPSRRPRPPSPGVEPPAPRTSLPETAVGLVDTP